MSPAETSRSNRRKPSNSGSALIIVLFLTSIVVMLAVVVLETGRENTRESTLVRTNHEVEALARLPAQIMVAQIQEATTKATTDSGERLTWASQPGMIRVFGTQMKSGESRPSAKKFYRLYSAAVMNSEKFDLAQEAAALNDWSSKPAAFTDLNEPSSSRGSVPAKVYPIADPAALGRVEGFAVRSLPPDSASNPLPMPAAWLYVLRDGQIVAPASVSGAVAQFDSAIVTATNPIVGRIAFWTDDESCKLNLNTASEGGEWDMPAANTNVERGFAANLPTSAERYRLSGHPGFTSLSPVLKTFGDAGEMNLQWPKADVVNPVSASRESSWQHYLDCYQALVPHGLDSNLKERNDRHFASVEEFWFDPKRQQNGKADGFLMEPSDLGMANFFLTTHTTSPELNPFGQPKITLRMIPQTTTDRNAADASIAIATSLNGGTSSAAEFAFQRASFWKSTTNQGSSQSMTDDWSQVKRNRELYAWLQSLTSKAFPGYGAGFVSKYGTRNRDQILTSMLDMLRWSTATADTLPPSLGSQNMLGLAEQSAVPLVPIMNATSEAGTTRGFGRFPTLTEVAVVFAFTDVERKSNGQPRDDDGDGICDRATKLRTFIVLDPFVVSCGQPAVSPAWSVRIRRLMQWTIGSGISPLLAGGNSRNRCTFSSSQPLSTGKAWGGNASAFACFASQFTQADGTPKQVGKRDDPNRDFPFISSGDVSLASTSGKPGGTVKFSGGRIIVDFMEPNAAQSQPKDHDAIQSVEIEFPETQLPMPSLRVSDFTSGARKLDDRFKPVKVNDETRLPIIQDGDIVRSMILNPNGPSRGDARLLAAQRELFYPDAASWFTPHPDYHSTTKLIAQSLRDGAYLTTGQYGAPSLQTTTQNSGSLLGKVTFASNAVPAVPLGLASASVAAVGSDPGGRLGDWESGIGALEDGAFVSRSRVMPDACFSRGALTNAKVTDRDPLIEMSSAVAFGAIPSGVFGDANSSTPRPWQTLLFCPNPAGRTTSASKSGRYDSTAHDHFGFASPPDHLWLEFFHTPVTEPCAITDRFATEGKVNLNHQLMPFTWMRRATALHGVFKGVRLAAIPTSAIDDHGASAKGDASGGPLSETFRYEIDAQKTIDGFDAKFDAGDVFRSASEICEQFLVPKRIDGHSYDGNGFQPRDPAHLKAADMNDWWNGEAANHSDAFEATGDNLREAPYGQLHPRLCTQSNVFRVHYRVQTLQKSRATLPGVWDEQRNFITAERRGSSVIERSLATSEKPFDDPVTKDTAASLHEKQNVRVVEQTSFSP